jgi:hypothetical protein
MIVRNRDSRRSRSGASTTTGTSSAGSTSERSYMRHLAFGPRSEVRGGDVDEAEVGLPQLGSVEVEEVWWGGEVAVVYVIVGDGSEGMRARSWPTKRHSKPTLGTSRTRISS